MDKLNKLITNCKRLIDMPYNQLNLDNYQFKVSEAYKVPICFKNTSSELPIKLMSGQDKNAGIIYSNYPINKKYKRKIYLIGKGILFDAGGYELKPEMDTMKIDMAGMAIAFGIASYFKENVIAYCPVSTNFIHNNQITPGDIIQIGKKEVEIISPDAEGRLILAETLNNLKVNSKDIVITIATLTGSVEIAIGTRATGVFCENNSIDLVINYLQASECAKEMAWRLPMWESLQKECFNRKIIKNHYKDTVGETLPGATMGAMFIKQFVKYPENWLHLDIAGSAYNAEKRKATGVPIKSLIHFIEKIK